MKITRRQRRQKVKRLTLQGLHQALISRVLGVSAPTVGHDQRALGLPPRIRFEHSTHPYKHRHTFATTLANELAQVFGDKLPSADQLGKVLTALPKSVPDQLKPRWTDEQWEQYRNHLANGIVAAIRARENRVHVN
jgi:hypothetical protein